MFKGLSLDQAPPFEAPLRFFLTAPIFGIIAGVLIFFDSNFFDIYSPQNIAIIHLFTIGFMSMVMIGAMQQMLPVLVGVRFPKPLFFSTIIHASLILGTILFAAGLYSFNTYIFFISVIFLLIGMGLFCIVTLYKLFRASFSSDTVKAMRLSLVSLMVVILLGSHLLVSLAIGKTGQYFYTFLSIHALFAIFGWVGLLIIGVSYQVIPMFYVTPDFQKSVKRYLSISIFILLFLTAISFFVNFKYVLISILILYSLFGMATLKQFKKRKRKLKDITIYFWIISNISLILGTTLLALNLFVQNNTILWLSGALLIYGFAISLINGMLYKIIPFLSWFHLSSKGFFDIPTMKEMIKEKDAKLQLIFHILALISLLVLPFFHIEKILALFIALSNLFLFANLLKAAKIYFAYKSKPSPMQMHKSF